MQKETVKQRERPIAQTNQLIKKTALSTVLHQLPTQARITLFFLQKARGVDLQRKKREFQS